MATVVAEPALAEAASTRQLYRIALDLRPGPVGGRRLAWVRSPWARSSPLDL